jgi:A/G-specific adenine glycosylase
MSTFSKTILHWYSENKRALPWRTTRDPYKIWLSEILLQQTRVAQGLPYYERFLKEYPQIEALAAAEESEILKLWQGLGYYSRARNLHASAKMITGELKGIFPSSHKELLALKGVGDYTASAIASICFDEATPVVDGNVYRVLARYYGSSVPINTPKGISYFKELALEVMDRDNAGEYNQAIMEFGAIQCTPQNPVCDSCPLNNSCHALNVGSVKELPVKLKKNKVKIRHFNYYVPLDHNGNTLLKKRVGKGIWENLFEFPLIESDRLLQEKEMKGAIENDDQFVISELVLWKEEAIIHKLSHQHLVTRFWIAQIDGVLKDGLSFERLETYPVPVLIADFIDTLKNSYFWPKEIS